MKTLVLTAHPDLSKSQINHAWFNALAAQPNVTVRDLTKVGGANYQFDVEKEQSLLLASDRIAFQFPFYWYSSPPILKAWLDQVLTYGFAYGPGGDKLRGREFLLLISTGGPADSYHAGGYNNYSMDELLKPFQQTAQLAFMRYLRPFVFHGMAQAGATEIQESTHAMIAHLIDPELDPAVKQARLLKELAENPDQASTIS